MSRPWVPTQVPNPIPGAPAAAARAGSGAEAFVAQHKTQLLAGGAGAVALLAFVLRSRSASSAAAADVADPTTPAAASVQSYATNGGGGVYSSGVTDFYDAIQPTLESIQEQIDKLANTAPGTVTPPTPTPTPVTPKPTPKPAVPAPTPKPVAPSLQNYVVRPGDNLSKIAAQFGVAGGASTGWKQIYAANTAVIGSNPNMIKPGQTLVIPR